MSRAFDPTNADAPAAAATQEGGDAPSEAAEASARGKSAIPLRRAVNQHSVCPFCGTINEATAKACRQCSMENTQATRQATRAKIGPWFVWQARNPAAPGMNWATLMALTEKGRITQRSVVRGPTTGQLWRFAARVKGLSREFGVCWHCGGELQKTARLCGACKRLQQPPANPDVLLETIDGAPPPRPAMRDPKTGGLLSLMPEPVRKEVAPPAVVTETPPAESAADIAANPASRPAKSQLPLDPDDGAMPVLDMGDDPMPSGVEMRAFQFPADYARGDTPRRSIIKRIAIAGALALAVLAGGLYFNPQVRAQYEHLFRSIMSHVKGPDGQRLGALDEPAPPVANASRNAPGPSPTPLMGLGRDPSLDVVHLPPATETATEPKPPVRTEITLGPGADDASADRLRKAQEKPAVTVTPSPKVSDSAAASAKITVTPPPPDPQAAERRAWELYGRAIKSEQRNAYGEAVKEYEWIEQLRLPDGVGPLDVEARLQRARQLANPKN